MLVKLWCNDDLSSSYSYDTEYSNFSYFLQRRRSTRRSINYASEHEEGNTSAFLSILRALARTVLHITLPINVVRVLTEQVENRGPHLLSILFSLHSTTRSHCRILKDRLREELMGDFEWNLISLPAKEQIGKERERERKVTGLHPSRGGHAWDIHISVIL